MGDFESGQVYRIMKQDSKGDFKCMRDTQIAFADKVAMIRDKEDTESSQDDTDENLVYIVS